MSIALSNCGHKKQVKIISQIKFNFENPVNALYKIVKL